jgi:pimeloyl-ACP methyl ester carboxylesterase
MRFRPAALAVLFCILTPLTSPSQSNTGASADTPRDKVETGTLAGASYRIDMPANWNGVLLVYYHGYETSLTVFDKDKRNDMGAGLASMGFAVAQSGYSVTGWAVKEALAETEALRLHTIERYGKPKETYVIGGSMGGLLAAATMESHPERYDGALPMCGALMPSTALLERSGAMRAAFDYYYPGLLPGPVNIPASFAFDKDVIVKVLTALPGNPTGMAELMALGQAKKVEDVASGVVFTTFILRDIEQKTGGSVIDNHNYIYAGGPDDNALNDGVKRYTASPATIDFLRKWYTLSGVLTKPTLAVHTTYDPLIPAESVSVYADLVERMGSGGNFVQQYVKADGHCNFSGPDTVAALNELIQWKREGKKPEGGLVPVPKQ